MRFDGRFGFPCEAARQLLVPMELLKLGVLAMCPCRYGAVLPDFAQVRADEGIRNLSIG
jgi:hypothetical protein